jgi:hypothetical protein
MPHRQQSLVTTAATIDPGRKATEEEASEANAEGLRILMEIEPFNLPAAAEIISRNRPSSETIARLAYLALDLYLIGQKAKRSAKMQGLGIASAAKRSRTLEYKRLADQLIAAGHAKREVAGKVAKRLHVTPAQVRKQLKKNRA